MGGCCGGSRKKFRQAVKVAKMAKVGINVSSPLVKKETPMSLRIEARNKKIKARNERIAARKRRIEAKNATVKKAI